MIDLATIENCRTPIGVAKYITTTYGSRILFDPFSSEEANRKTGLARYIRTRFDKKEHQDNDSNSIYLFPPDESYIREYIDLFHKRSRIKTLFISLPAIVVGDMLQNLLLTNAMLFVIIPQYLGLYSEYENQCILYNSKPLESFWHIYILTKRMEVIERFQKGTPKEYRTFLNSSVGTLEEKKFMAYFTNRKG